jgi:hypothetical protein
MTEDDWVLLVQTLGRITDIQNLTLHCSSGSRDFHPFQAVADAVNNAHSLRALYFALGSVTFPGDSSGLIALANALREHTNLQVFGWIDLYSQTEAAQITTIDSVLQALPACQHLREVDMRTKYASADAIRNLLQLQSATELRLVLKMDHWLAVADEIRRGRCNVRSLDLFLLPVTTSEATEAVKALASAMLLDQNLEHLTFELAGGFADEAGVALAEALTVNTTLCKITLSATSVYLGTQAYEAFSAMLRVNTSLNLVLPAFNTGGANASFLECRNQMRIEQRLNEVGRGRLLSSSIQTTREEYVDALYELSSTVVYYSPTFRLGCVFSLLRLNPSVVSMS